MGSTSWRSRRGSPKRHPMLQARAVAAHARPTSGLRLSPSDLSSTSAQNAPDFAAGGRVPLSCVRNNVRRRPRLQANRLVGMRPRIWLSLDHSRCMRPRRSEIPESKRRGRDFRHPTWRATPVRWPARGSQQSEATLAIHLPRASQLDSSESSGFRWPARGRRAPFCLPRRRRLRGGVKEEPTLRRREPPRCGPCDACALEESLQVPGAFRPAHCWRNVVPRCPCPVFASNCRLLPCVSLRSGECRLFPFSLFGSSCLLFCSFAFRETVEQCLFIRGVVFGRLPKSETCRQFRTMALLRIKRELSCGHRTLLRLSTHGVRVEYFGSRNMEKHGF